MRLKLFVLFLVLILLSVIISASVLADQYAFTEAYFFIPSDVSFTVSIRGDPLPAFTSGGSYPGGTTTTWISFNTSSWPVTDIEPWTLGVDQVANRQDYSSSLPIYEITNDGNIPFDFYIYFEALDACLEVEATSECGYGLGNCGGASGFVTNAEIEFGEGGVDANGVMMVDELPHTDGQDLLYIYFFGDFGAGCSPQEYGPYIIRHRSTAD
jgi:hypothetical protein